MGSPRSFLSRQFCHPFVLRVGLPGPSLFFADLVVFLSAQASSLQVWSNRLVTSESQGTFHKISDVPSVAGNEADAVSFVCSLLSIWSEIVLK